MGFLNYLNGTITTTTNPQDIIVAQNITWDGKCPKYSIVILSDTRDSLQFPGCSMLSQLLPPPLAIEFFLNNDVLRGIDIYKKYLRNPELEPAVSMLLSALQKPDKFGNPINVVLYAEYDSDINFHIFQVLYEFFATNFGLLLTPFNPNIPIQNMSPQANEFRYRIAEILLNNQYINFGMYSMIAPINSMPSPRTCNLILRKLNYGFRDMKEIQNVCLNFLDNTRREVTTGLKNPIMVMKDKMDKEKELKTHNEIMNNK